MLQVVRTCKNPGTSVRKDKSISPACRAKDLHLRSRAQAYSYADRPMQFLALPTRDSRAGKSQRLRPQITAAGTEDKVFHKWSESARRATAREQDLYSTTGVDICAFIPAVEATVCYSVPDLKCLYSIPTLLKLLILFFSCLCSSSPAMSSCFSRFIVCVKLSSGSCCFFSRCANRVDTRQIHMLFTSVSHTGYRHIHLLSKDGTGIPPASLFVHIRLMALSTEID